MAGDPTAPRPITALKEFTAVLALYGVLTLLYFYPSLASFSTSLLGPPEDNMQIYWFIWYGGHALLDPALPFLKSPFIYFPEGFDLHFANYYYYGVFCSVVLKLFLNAVEIYNFLVLHTFVFAGVGAFYLLKYLTRDTLASLVGGFVFAFNPSHVAHASHHVTLATIQFFPLFLLFLMKSVRERGRLALLWATLFLVLCALASWNYLIFGLILLILAYGYLAIRRRNPFPIDIVFKMVLIGGGAFLILSPLIVPLVAEGLRHEFGTQDTAWLTDALQGFDLYVVDPVALFVPFPGHLLSGLPGLPQLNETILGVWEQTWERLAYLGWINILILVCAFRKTFRHTLKYWLGFLAFTLLAMGSHLQVLGQKLGVVLPYRLIEWTPLLHNARAPSRIMVLAYLFLAILVAFSFSRLFSPAAAAPHPPGVKRRWAAGVAAVLIFFDFHSVSAQSTVVELPAAYRTIVSDPSRDFGILELPWEGARYMMYQTLHERPIVQGYVGRKRGKTLIDKLPADLTRAGEHRAIFRQNKVKYIVLHKRKLNWAGLEVSLPDYRRVIEKFIALYAKDYEKIHDDVEAAVFKVY